MVGASAGEERERGRRVRGKDRDRPRGSKGGEAPGRTARSRCGAGGPRRPPADGAGTGAQVLTNARDDTLCLVDTRKYDVVRTLRHPAYKNGVNWNRAAVSPDGQFAAAGGSEGAVFLWELASGAHLGTLVGGHTSAVAACSWGDNDQLASVEKEHRMVLWE